MSSVHKVCRLCLDDTSRDFESLDSKLGMLKTVSLDLDLTLSADPLICSKCLDVLQETFDFKTTCLNNEVYLKSFLDPANDVKLTLDTIIKKDAVKTATSPKQSVCRFCLRYSDNDCFTKLDNVEEDIFLKAMLEKCLPEMGLGITNCPLMCHNCLENLQNLFNFLTACLDNDEKIKKYLSANGVGGNDQIDLIDVLNFTKNESDDYKNIKTDLDCVKVENLDTTSCDVAIKEEFEEIERDELHVKIDETAHLEIANEAQQDNHKRPNASKTQAKVFQCQYCVYSTKRKDHLIRHVKVIHEHVIYGAVKKFQCDHCDYKSFYKTHLTMHLRTHDANFQFQCQSCGKSFNRRVSLDGHILKHHPDLQLTMKSRIYNCDYCDYKTVYTAHMSAHINSSHSGTTAKTYTCDVCNYSCIKKNTLVTHLYTHSTFRRFSCKKCNKGFNQKCQLDAHILHSHRDDPELFKVITNKINHCQFCSYKTILLSHLKRHVDVNHKAVA